MEAPQLHTWTPPSPPPAPPRADLSYSIKAGAAVIGIGVLLGGGLLAGGVCLFTRTLPSPIHTFTALTYRSAVSMIIGGGGIVVITALVGAILIKDGKEKPRITNASELTVELAMIQDGPIVRENLLRQIYRDNPNLKKLKFADGFVNILEGTIVNMPQTIEDLEISLVENSDALRNAIEIAGRLQNLNHYTVRLNSKDMTRESISSLVDALFTMRPNLNQIDLISSRISNDDTPEVNLEEIAAALEGRFTVSHSGQPNTVVGVVYEHVYRLTVKRAQGTDV